MGRRPPNRSPPHAPVARRGAARVQAQARPAQFAAYGEGSPAALALGGRYDLAGEAFGRGRPATGFSLDLRQLALGLPDALPSGAVLAPCDDDVALQTEVRRLRAAGQAVMVALPGHESTWKEAGCDRQLIRRDGEWVVVALQGA